MAMFKRSSMLEETSGALGSASQCVQKELSRSGVQRTSMILLAILGIGFLYWAGPEIAREWKIMRM